MQFGVNFLGHSVLIKFLLPTLLQTAAQPPGDVRIVLLTSAARAWVPKAGIAFEDLRTRQS
jgi:hypothetical protein